MCCCCLLKYLLQLRGHATIILITVCFDRTSVTPERFAHEKHYKCVPQHCTYSKWSSVMSFFVMNVQYMMINSYGFLFVERNQLFCNKSGQTSFCLSHSLNRDEADLCLASHVNFSVQGNSHLIIQRKHTHTHRL